MSSHIDKFYTTQLKAMITVIASMQSAPRESVRVIAHPYRRHLTFWQKPKIKEVFAVPFEEFYTPANEPDAQPAIGFDDPPPGRYFEEQKFPSVLVQKGYLAQSDKGTSVILYPPTNPSKRLPGVYQEMSIEGFLNKLTIRATHHDEIISIEECVWQTFGQFLHDYHQFKCTYEELQLRIERLQRRGRHKTSKQATRR